MYQRFLGRNRRCALGKIIGQISGILVPVVLFVLILELGFRMIPGAIPDSLLANFNPDLRAEIASKIGLPTLADTVLIDRDDDGPELRVPKPFTTRIWPDRDPGSVDSTQMDHDGFCNPVESELDERSDEQSIEIVSLGDSFIWCTAIDPQDTWTSKLSSISGYSTYNLAAPDLGVHEYLQIFKRFGIEKSPRFVIMNIYEGTDLRDASLYEEYVSRDRQSGVAQDVSNGGSNRLTTLPYDPCLVFHSSRQSLIGRNSYASNAILVVAQNVCDEVSETMTPDSVFPDENQYLDSDLGYRFMYPDLTIEFNLKNVGADDVLYADRLRSQDADLAVFDKPLKAFVDLARTHDFVPIVTYTPSAYTAYEDNVVFHEPALGDLMRWFSRHQRDYFKVQGESLGYLFLDLTPFLQKASQATDEIQDLLYFRSNVHLTQRGHTVVAEAVSSALGLIDSVEN